MPKTKPFKISKQLVYQAYRRVKANKGGSGVDGESLRAFDADRANNLYKLWNRMSSGSYMPPPVNRVEIPKAGGGTRPLGIPTVSDRIAQMVVKLLIEPGMESIFHPDSYGYRPRRSAHDALRQVQNRCKLRPWVLDMDIQGFFDTIDHGLLMKAVRKHVKDGWQLLYIERWLKAPVEHPDGRLALRDRGTPQGGVISPLLANLFLHYVFDVWVEKNWGGIQFERYADDIVCHCASEPEAKALRRMLEHRFEACGLRLHPEKTKVVYCMGGYHRERHEHTVFEFLGFAFKPTWIRNRHGEQCLHFIASVSQKSAKRIRDEIKRWPWRYWVQKELVDIHRYSCSRLRGWLEYYGLFGRSVIREVLYHFDCRLVRWAKKKYKKLKTLPQAMRRVNSYRKRNPLAFPHWRVA